MSNSQYFMSKSLIQNIGTNTIIFVLVEKCRKKHIGDKKITIIIAIKKATKCGFFNGGTDEARTRDLLRDRQTL